ncbi:MAG TPA: hypothetical protein VK926_09245, partial [Gaiellaceae bacterium]|nr:hypothetical protein [Gaiellaceae bacterium]
MSLDDWILSLHVLSAFAMVAALVLFWILIVAMRDVDTVDATIAYWRVLKVGNGVVIAGIAGTIVFGIWLAISLDRYQVWDGWIVAAIVLWLIGSGTGARAGTEYGRALTRADELRSSGQEGRPGELRALNR